MSILSRLKKAIGLRTKAVAPNAIPAGKGRIHLLTGDFRDEAAARAYCYEGGVNRPEMLTRDQPGAFINTQFVEVNFGEHSMRLFEILHPDIAERLLHEIDGQNTLIIIDETAFGNLPFRLIGTDRLSYLGAELVDV